MNIFDFISNVLKPVGKAISWICDQTEGMQKGTATAAQITPSVDALVLGALTGAGLPATLAGAEQLAVSTVYAGLSASTQAAVQAYIAAGGKI